LQAVFYCLNKGLEEVCYMENSFNAVNIRQVVAIFPEVEHINTLVAVAID
jgi:hypothetical protein